MGLLPPHSQLRTWRLWKVLAKTKEKEEEKTPGTMTCVLSTDCLPRPSWCFLVQGRVKVPSLLRLRERRLYSVISKYTRSEICYLWFTSRATGQKLFWGEKKGPSQEAWHRIWLTTILTDSVSDLQMRKRPQVILMQNITHIFVTQQESAMALRIARGYLCFYPNSVFS